MWPSNVSTLPRSLTHPDISLFQLTQNFKLIFAYNQLLPSYKLTLAPLLSCVDTAAVNCLHGIHWIAKLLNFHFKLDYFSLTLKRNYSRGIFSNAIIKCNAKNDFLANFIHNKDGKFLIAVTFTFIFQPT